MSAWAALYVDDLAAMVTFFQDQLSWQIGDQPAQDVIPVHDHEGAVLMLVGPAASNIAPYLRPNAVVKRPGAAVTFAHSAVEILERDLRQRGLAVGPIITTAWHDRELAIHAPEGYTLRFVTPAQLANHEALELYLQGPAALEAALAGLTSAELDCKLADSQWSIRQLVHHIVDGDALWSMAIKAALAASGCSYSHPWYTSNDDWAKALDYASRPLEPGLALLRANRAHIAELLEHLPDAWERHVLFHWNKDAHTPRKATTALMVQMQARHVLEHSAEIQAACAQHGLEQEG